MAQSPPALTIGPHWNPTPRLPASPGLPSPDPPKPDSDPETAFDPEELEASLTSLDPDETTVGFDPTSVSPPDAELPEVISGAEMERRQRLSQSFRHGFWHRKRDAVAWELQSLDVPPERLRRFRECGCTSWVLRDQADPGRYRLASNKCRDRFCDACQVEKRRTVCANVQARLPRVELRQLTLTLLAGDDPLDDQLRKLYSSFRRFRQRARIKPLMTGGIYFLELTLNTQTRQWHPHLHVMFEGSFLPHEIAKREWHDVTGDSYIVDIRRVGDSRSAASHLAKYASKALGASVWNDHDRLREAMIALAGRRTFSTFGTWTALELSKIPDDPATWDTIGPLWQVMDRANAGDEESIKIIRYLATRCFTEPFTIVGSIGDSS